LPGVKSLKRAPILEEWCECQTSRYQIIQHLLELLTVKVALYLGNLLEQNKLKIGKYNLFTENGTVMQAMLINIWFISICISCFACRTSVQLWTKQPVF
jgi:hypothetical protein